MLYSTGELKLDYRNSYYDENAPVCTNYKPYTITD